MKADDPRTIVLDLYEGFNEEGHLSEAAEEAVEGFAFKLIERFCEKLGHRPLRDHCDRSEHDYCAECRAILPGAAH